MLNTASGMVYKPWTKIAMSGVIAVAISLALGGCGDKSHGNKASQSLVSVNGKEITVHQLNEELARANVQAAQKDAASKQILSALVDRQLLEQAAAKAKVDRDPNVMQAVERAKAQIVAQAYLQGRVASVAKPEKAEIEAFYKQNPPLFSERKLVEMEQLLLDSRQITDEFKASLGNFKSLQEVAAWLDTKGVQYDRGEVARSVAELPPQISERLKDARKGQLFVIGMGPRTMLVQMDTVKDNPVSLADASAQIEQLLLNKKRKEAGEAELQRLKAEAKIEYLDSSIEKPKTELKEVVKKKADDDISRGVSGLK
ncbi:EpsD family peptidyl-prolyl cis-trans isomerase [Methylobacillus gramineus]|uniref:EpsD family peptidyl-prolyl cis-trans isomerase n=1 Tax=Methylobacillus gramineus TaxID=755169 RepID=UPI001D00098C|nr:EpsD family peptidyl-prolyl cis-trans isomerase [Methylobacillus gramineus]MCB5183683.1 EpsD family peptidyl-prolyl cis-trans isomerase [Methylobacillus gramineus]